MRIWSVHPSYLDAKGLVALWREALLAQKVLAGRTKGYRHHPQLQRFRKHSSPLSALRTYLAAVADEADSRGYSFDRSKIGKGRIPGKLSVTRGQLNFEFEHLKKKLKKRDPQKLKKVYNTDKVKPHPLFRVVQGGIANWEKV